MMEAVQAVPAFLVFLILLSLSVNIYRAKVKYFKYKCTLNHCFIFRLRKGNFSEKDFRMSNASKNGAFSLIEKRPLSRYGSSSSEINWLDGRNFAVGINYKVVLLSSNSSLLSS